VGFSGWAQRAGGLKEYLNQHTLAGDARMRRELFKGSFLYVEGSSDGKLYGMFVDCDRCQIIIAYNQFNVIEACRILEREAFAGAIGIVDADFNHLEGKTPDVSIVFQTDMHDGECFMLSTIAFNKLLTEFASQEKLTVWQKAYVADVRNHLLQEAAIVGCLLWHSNRSVLNLCFNGLEAKEYVGDADLKTDVSKLITHVKNKSQGKAKETNSEQLVDGLQQRLKASDKMWQIVRGHDIIDMLCFALRKTLGNWKAQESTRENIERGLRLAYAEDDFSQTELFIQIRKWEAAHAPFRVFRNLRQQGLGF
jgi:hypothetical protein